MPVFIPSFFFGILHEQPTIKCCDFASYPFSTPYTLTTAYIKLLKSGSELVIPFSTRFRSFRVNSFSNVFHYNILHDVPATIIFPESCSLSCNVNAVEISLCISNSPSPIVQMSAIPSAVRWLRIN